MKDFAAFFILRKDVFLRRSSGLFCLIFFINFFQSSIVSQPVQLSDSVDQEATDVLFIMGDVVVVNHGVETNVKVLNTLKENKSTKKPATSVEKSNEEVKIEKIKIEKKYHPKQHPAKYTITNSQSETDYHLGSNSTRFLSVLSSGSQFKILLFFLVAGLLLAIFFRWSINLFSNQIIRSTNGIYCLFSIRPPPLFL